MLPIDHGAMDEANEFFTALRNRAPDEPTACRGWRVRDLVAHVAAGAQEEADLIETHLRGGTARPTRSFDEREAAYRALPYDELLGALAREGGSLNAAVDALIRSGGEVEFTGIRLSGQEFRVHSRSELALHRWDIVGDDETGHQLLAQPVLTAHAAKVLSGMASLQESAAARAVRVHREPEDFAFRMRSPGSDDLLVQVAPMPSVKMMSPVTDELPVIRCSPADRLLAVWGRRLPDARIDLSCVTAREADRINAFLYL
ncbi:maleylpyruvate isomerase N-terminal domain-containing protein [Streptomyces sp. NPDC091217]|uniref:maleylpyruvate isomerase N-terminal domain-containing protein n=1 Tax=Streptomyces sp. NPDC091217 TaxID=3365975 RepID=UPI00381D45FF